MTLHLRVRGILTAVALLALGACGGGEPQHPWLSVPENADFQIIESSGVGEGQIVIAMEPPVAQARAVALGEEILAQAPADATVNARIYNDEATARNWSTVDAVWTNEHLLVVATRTRTGGDEVRWVRGEEEGPAGPQQQDSVAEAVSDTAAAP